MYLPFYIYVFRFSCGFHEQIHFGCERKLDNQQASTQTLKYSVLEIFVYVSLGPTQNSIYALTQSYR